MESNEKLAMEKLKAGDPPPRETPMPPGEPEVSSTICEDTGEPIHEEAPRKIPLEPP